ncbi:MAG: hypothetical protein K2X86_05000 [Cytophagaceae bacterium]|nr:hypothetical protein [Cytophagaceae bacterium]
MRLSLSLFILMTFSSMAFSQEENDNYYESETGVGLNLNTNGGIIGGAMFKHARRVSGTDFHLLGKNEYHYFGLEIVNVKHPKEQRVSSPLTGNTYIYYKQNYLFVFRPQYGREVILFHQAEEEGVRVNAVFATGPSLGILKPYAIDYDYTNYNNYSGPPKDVRSEPFDPQVHVDVQGRVLGTGGLFTAMNKSKFNPGWHFKAGLAFEFGNSASGVEVGGLIELYPKEIVILPYIQNRNIFTSIYVNLYFAQRN